MYYIYPYTYRHFDFMFIYLICYTNKSCIWQNQTKFFCILFISSRFVSRTSHWIESINRDRKTIFKKTQEIRYDESIKNHLCQYNFQTLFHFDTFHPSFIQMFLLKDKSKKKWKVLESPCLTHVDNRTATWPKRHEIAHAGGWGGSFFIYVPQTSGHQHDHFVFGPLDSRRDPWIWKNVFKIIIMKGKKKTKIIIKGKKKSQIQKRSFYLISNY